MLELEFDGLFRPSPVSPTAGIMCVGWLVRSGGNILAKGYAVIARGTDATSNIAEYLAMIEGLQALIDMRGHARAHPGDRGCACVCWIK